MLMMKSPFVLSALLACLLLAAPIGGDVAGQPSFRPPSHPGCFCSNQHVVHDCGFARPLSEVVNAPQHIDIFEQPACLVEDVWLQPQQPVFSIILTVFNKEALLPVILEALLEKTSEPWELVLVFDGCKDESIPVALQVLRNHSCLSSQGQVHARQAQSANTQAQPQPGSSPAGAVALAGHRRREAEQIAGSAASAHASHSSSGVDSRSGSSTGAGERTGGGSSGLGGKCTSPELVHVRLVKQPSEVWETSANNLGMRAALGRWWVLLQDDHLVLETGWNAVMAAPARAFPDVLAVTARCAHHAYSALPQGAVAAHQQGAVGRCVHGSLEMPLQPPESLQAAAGGPAGGHAAAGAAAGMDLAGPSLTPLEEGLLKWRCTFVVRDSVNRGPLLLDGEKMKTLGYLDEQNIFFEDDDHDLMARAWVQHKWVGGYLPLNFSSPIAWGARRMGRPHPPTHEEEMYLEARKERAWMPFLTQLSKGFAGARPTTHDGDRPLPAELCPHHPEYKPRAQVQAQQQGQRLRVRRVQRAEPQGQGQAQEEQALPRVRGSRLTQQPVLSQQQGIREAGAGEQADAQQGQRQHRQLVQQAQVQRQGLGQQQRPGRRLLGQELEQGELAGEQADGTEALDKDQQAQRHERH